MNSILKLFYGGTYDPIHNGHIAIACAARDQLNCHVALMPAADPPHRAPYTSAYHRCAMVENAITSIDGLSIELNEIQRSQESPQRPSYTSDTVRYLRKQLGETQPFGLLIGQDSLETFSQWHDWQDLFELCHWIVAPRGLNPTPFLLNNALKVATEKRFTTIKKELTEFPSGKIFILDSIAYPHSSTEIRRRLKAQENWQEWVPNAVANYIQEQDLYSEI